MKFNEQQKEIIHTTTGNVAVIAAAGSGKTSSIVHRIKHMTQNEMIPPSSILAVTFSRKSKDTINERLDELDIYGVNVETFHSLALKIICYANAGKRYEVWNAQWEREMALTDICRSLGCDVDDLPFNEIMSFISLQKVNMIKPGGHLIFYDDQPFNDNVMTEIYKGYEKYKSSKRYIEFDDFLNMANDIFDECTDVLHKYQNQFQYVLVDEFQDVSLPQALFLKKLNTKNTLIVGDPLQAIYSFRGGDSKYILNFDREYKDVKVINLNTNYRCSADIVTTANKLASTIPDSLDRNYVESIANNDKHKKPEFRSFFTDTEEYKYIAKKTQELINDGYKYSDIAVLSRTNAQLQKLETIMHKSDIGFEILNGELFTELLEIKLIISYLKLSLNPDDDEAFSFLYNKPNRWLNKKFLEETVANSKLKHVSLYKSMSSIARRNWRFKNGIDEIYEVIRHLQTEKYENVAELVRYLRSRLNIDYFVSKGKVSDDGGSTEQVENLNSFEEICSEFSSVSELINYLDKLNDDMANIKKPRVKLSTIHRSKGMEFPVVFIVGCGDGILPHHKNPNIFDEKRLFYVAITRAEKELYLSYSNLCNGLELDVSPFIEDIKDTINIIK